MKLKMEDKILTNFSIFLAIFFVYLNVSHQRLLAELIFLLNIEELI